MNASGLRELSIEELQGLLSYADAQKIDEHQTDELDTLGRTPLERITDRSFFPQEVIDEHGREALLGSVACNISLYDDEIEAAIDEDEFLSRINAAKVTDPDNAPAYTAAIRIRRSIIVLLRTYNQLPVTLMESPAPDQSPSTPAA